MSKVFEKVILFRLNHRLEKDKSSSITKLLKVLNTHSCFSNLPTDARTLLKTHRTVILSTISGGTYYHFGIEKGIQQVLSQCGEKIPLEIKLLVNIDGSAIANSSSSQFWPILDYLSYSVTIPSVFPIGIFHGNNKPLNVHDYLNDFVTEINELLIREVAFKN